MPFGYLGTTPNQQLNNSGVFSVEEALQVQKDGEWGGSLQFWSHDDKNKKPLSKVKEIEPIFNKAILFDTTQNSWHGFPEPINPPRGKMRKSIAVYYMTDITSSAQERYRARYVGV